MSEMEISRAVAERSLREHLGNVVEALVALTNWILTHFTLLDSFLNKTWYVDSLCVKILLKRQVTTTKKVVVWMLLPDYLQNCNTNIHAVTSSASMCPTCLRQSCLNWFPVFKRSRWPCQSVSQVFLFFTVGRSNTSLTPAAFCLKNLVFWALSWAQAESKDVVSWSTKWVYLVRPDRPKFLTWGRKDERGSRKLRLQKKPVFLKHLQPKAVTSTSQFLLRCQTY